MASAIGHVIAAVGLGTIVLPLPAPRRLWIFAAACSVLPDIDAVGFHLGVPYGAFWGHRGFTHSLLFAAALASAVLFAAFKDLPPPLSKTRLWSYLFVATASHGVLDAMTNGGLGVAFFSPFDTSRYFFPWRPILVSPISITRFFTTRGLAVLQSEILWIWIPTICVAAIAYLSRSRRAPEPR